MKLMPRLLGYLFVIWLGATVNFLLPRLLPGDPVEFLVGEEVIRLTPQQHQAVLAQFGLDKPLLSQYWDYLGSLAKLDLGTSVAQGAPVFEVISSRVPWTLLLVGSAIVLSFLLGFLLACLFHALRKPQRASGLLGSVVLLGSLPPFWVGMLLIAVFAAGLGWLPSHGATDPEANGWAAAVSVLRHAMLPMATLTLAYLPSVFLLARSGLQEALGSGYVALARAHGASPARILFRQATPNVILPLVNQFAMSFGTLLGGTVVVESVFAYPGLGLALYEGILAHDFPLVQGLFLLLVCTVVLGNCIADALQVLLDPRLHPSQKRLS